MAQSEVWVTQSLQFPAAYYKDFNLLSGQSSPFGGLSKVMDVHGVVLKHVTTMGMLVGPAAGSGAGKPAQGFTETAASVEKGAIPGSMFEPPAGYKSVTAKATQ
jgi:hypothetical protein